MSMQPVTVSADIKTLSLFHDIHDSERDELILSGKVRSFAKGDMLFMHGDPLKSFYIVTDGAIRQFRETPDGKEITVGLAVRGDIVGGSHIFESFKAYQWSAVAAENTAVLEYPIFWFKERVKTHGALALNMLAVLSQDTHRAAVDAEHLVTFTAAQRVACFLLRLCALYSFDPKNFDLPYSKTTIASKLGMELETFSRTLQKLKEAGVEVKGTQVSIKNLHTLECFMCGHCSISEDCATVDALHERGCHSEQTMVRKIKSDCI